MPTRAGCADNLAGLIGTAGSQTAGRPPAPADEPPRLAASVTVLRESVGFTPRFALADGLANTLAWWREHVKLGNGPAADHRRRRRKGSSPRMIVSCERVWHGASPKHHRGTIMAMPGSTYRWN